ncbi:MAG: hypothetical protein R3Y47_08670 [Lachnospiraceae bacterium]
MSGKTKIFVWHMKEVIYTAIFLFLGLVLLFLLAIMFFPKESTSSTPSTELEETIDTDETTASSNGIYQPGIYTATMEVGGNPVSLQVVIETAGITDVSFVQLSETVETMYPLLSSVIETISAQLQSGTTLEAITYESTQQYTASVILDAIEEVVALSTK